MFKTKHNCLRLKLSLIINILIIGSVLTQISIRRILCLIILYLKFDLVMIIINMELI